MLGLPLGRRAVVSLAGVVTGLSAKAEVSGFSLTRRT